MERNALIFSSPGQVMVVTESLQAPQPGQVLVETLLTAISPGTEMLVYRGEMPEGLQADETIAALGGALRYPLKYGYCAVGRIAATGEGVDRALNGKQVFSFQPHQSAFAVQLEDLVILPEDISPEDAVFLPNMETALGLVMDGAPLAGERVAVIGQGIVGLLTTQLLAQFPLAKLIAFDRYELRREASSAAGAGESLPAGKVTGSHLHAYDLVFELSGTPAALDTAVELAGDEGRVVIGSWYGSKRAGVDLGGHFHRGRLKFISSQVSRLAPHLTGRWTKARRLDFVLELIARMRPSGYITHRFHLDRAVEAYRLVDAAPEKTIQVVFDYV